MVKVTMSTCRKRMPHLAHKNSTLIERFHKTYLDAEFIQRFVHTGLTL